MKNVYEIKPIKKNSKNIAGYLKLFSICFPKETKFTPEYLNWLYFKNPNGPVIGYDAWLGENLVAHYASIPIETLLNGIKEKTILSINSSTHPSHTRNGLFLKLAKKTHEKARLRGFKNVIAVSNKNATPGRLKYLDFKLISPLTIKIALFPLKALNPANLDKNLFRVVWEKKTLLWRLSCPGKPLFLSKNKTSMGVHGLRTFKIFVPYLETPFLGHHSDTGLPLRKISIGIKLTIGLSPKLLDTKYFSFTIPSFLKPTPLNLIFKRLDKKNFIPKKDTSFFNFLDFDIL